MAIGTLRCGVMGNGEPRMVKHRARPRGSVVAGSASCGESRRHVIGIGRPRIIHLMARVAIRRRSGENIIDVATAAGHRDVRAGQGKRRARVVEGRARPACRRVADGAVRGKPRRHMGRVRGSGKVSLMATVASGIGAGQVVVSIHMALLAGRGNVRTGECKSRGGMIERRGAPGCRGVTLLAGCGEAGLDVTRTIGGVVIGQVARDAGRVAPVRL